MNHKSAGLAAVLSFVLPGIGHAYLGRRRDALVFALPALLVAGTLGLSVLADVDSALGFLITPTGAMTALVLILLTMAWRALAIVDVIRIVQRKRYVAPSSMAAAGIAVVLVLATHLGAGYLAWSVYDAGTRIFVGAGPDDSGGPGASLRPGATPTDDDYNVAPIATPEGPDARINILLTGIDSAETRTTALTDTLIVVSIDPVERTVVMLSLPRDISNFELYDGRTFQGKVNSFMTWVRNHPGDFADRPFPALMKQVGHMVGVPIHYFAAVDLQGFRRMIDAVGGVTVDNPRAIDDPRYEWLDGTYGFTLPAGQVRLDGRTALAYARSRQGVGDSDFTRAARQQQLLVALRSKLTRPEMLPQLPEIIQAAGDTVRTNLPTERMEEFIALAREVDTDAIQRVVLGPPYAYHPPTSSTGGVYTLRLDPDRVARLSVELFGDDSRYAAGE